MNIKIEKLDNYGRGIGYYKKKIAFINNALPNENVSFDIIKEDKKYILGNQTSIKKEAKERVKPKCPYYDYCGGCSIMHMNDNLQDEFKIEKAQDILKKYAGIDNEIKLIKSNKNLFYRNKVTLKVKDNIFGYYNYNTHMFIGIDSCLIASLSINEIIKNHKFIDIGSGEIVIRSNYKDEILINISSEEQVFLEEELIPKNVIGIIENDRVIYGKSYLIDKIGLFDFKISYNSFFQVNNFIANEIFKILNNNLSGENLLDLYCGSGALGISLKNKYKNIYGVEINNNSIKDAKDNAELNNINNIYFYTGNTDDVVDNLNISFDTILVDPPRSGLSKKTLDFILNKNPKKLAYISCDIMTLSRDLKELLKKYTIEKINVLDMFPNTFHIECVCILTHKSF